MDNETLAQLVGLLISPPSGSGVPTPLDPLKKLVMQKGFGVQPQAQQGAQQGGMPGGGMGGMPGLFGLGQSPNA